jgi:hypothetical protein
MMSLFARLFKPGKTGLKYVIVTFALLLLVSLFLGINKYKEQMKINNEMQVYVRQFFDYKLPEKTDKVEELYYYHVSFAGEISDDYDVYLVLNSDLTLDELQGYYNNADPGFMSSADPDAQIVFSLVSKTDLKSIQEFSKFPEFKKCRLIVGSKEHLYQNYYVVTFCDQGYGPPGSRQASSVADS